MHGESTEDGAYLNVLFSHPVLFYEEAYTNAPGDVVGKRVSTNVIVTCTAKGGVHGGVLTLSRSGFDKLLFVSGEEMPEGSITLAPNEARVWEGIYAPLVHSDVKDDIVASATFSEHHTAEFIQEEEKLTVVKLELLPWVTLNDCTHRHIVGVGENVLCVAIPHVGQWNKIGDGTLDEDANYFSPLVSSIARIKYSVGRENFYLTIKIMEPTGIVSRNVKAKDFGLTLGKAGGVGMDLELYVVPESVSFTRISLQEVPSMDGFRSGFFANQFFSYMWYHTIEMGAGSWDGVGHDNYCGLDHAWKGDVMPLEMSNGEMTMELSEGRWRDGMLIWYIQWGWARKEVENGEAPVKKIAMRYDQSFMIDEYGTLTITKFDNTIARGTNNVIQLNGLVVEGEPLTEEEKK